MHIVAQHHSPDGLLRLIVTRDDDGDTAVGFDGYSWHTHGDILASLSGLPEDQAIQQFVEDLIADRAIIVVSRVREQIRDIWPTEDPVAEFKYKPPVESLEFRRWSGVPITVDRS